MKTKLFLFLIFLLGGVISFSQTTVQDIDGNSYAIVKIDTQYWMGSNLLVEHFNDGTPIDHITKLGIWNTWGEYAYCWWGNDSVKYASVGALYNRYAVTDKICPSGWHIPSDTEFQAALTVGTPVGFLNPNGYLDVTNGFTFDPYYNSYCYLWTSTSANPSPHPPSFFGLICTLNNINATVNSYQFYPFIHEGLGIRCVKGNKNSNPPPPPPPPTLNQSVNASSITIGPNPSTGQFIIYLKDLPENEIIINIMDVTGKLIYSQKHSTFSPVEINIKEKGLYIVKINNIVKKIIVQ